MKYYASYKPETGKTHIVAYDEAKRVGRYSNRPVILPDGRQTTPDRPGDVFVPWSDVKGERWPGDPINQN